jgi:MurNAc alpha-1-phosphate uridylyltransferase
MSAPIDTAFVLAAGLGTRMRPLTDTIPKPLVSLAGRTLLDRVLDRIAAAGIARAVVNVHHHADLIERHLAKRGGAPLVEISDERDTLLETGGGVVRALPRLGDKPFLIHNADTVWIEGVGSNLARLIAAWDGARMDSLMLLATAANSIGYEGAGDFVMDAEGRLSRRGERQMAPFVFAGASIAHPRLFAGARQERFSLNIPWNQAIAARRLFGVRLDGVWMHVGTPASLAAAERRMEEEDAA